MSSTSLTPDEIRAAAETHRELGPEYQTAVIESFLDKVGKEIDARVDNRLARAPVIQPGQVAPAKSGRGLPFTLAIVSMTAGIPLSAISLAVGNQAGLAALAIVWVAITIINVAFSMHSRPPADGR